MSYRARTYYTTVCVKCGEEFIGNLRDAICPKCRAPKKKDEKEIVSEKK